MAARQGVEQALQELEGPGLPPLLVYVWEWFCELSAARGSNGFGANPISWAEIDAWAQRMRRNPSVFELELLQALDAAFVISMATEPGKRR